MGNKPVTAKRQETCVADGLQAGMADMQGHRESMEDAHILCAGLPGKPSISLFAVFDGHGGDAVAKASADQFVLTLAAMPEYDEATPEDAAAWGRLLHGAFLELDGALRRTLTSAGRAAQGSGRSAVSSVAGFQAGTAAVTEEDDDPRLSISDAWQSAVADGRAMTPAHGARRASSALELDMGLVDISQGGSAETYMAGGVEEEEEDHSGATAVVALLLPGHIVVANAGDSRAVLVRGAGGTPLSEDHKPSLPQEEARVQAAGGAVMRGRVNGELAVSRALGDFGYKDRPDLPPAAQKVSPEPDITITPRQPEGGDGRGDAALVLACDGVWDVMSNVEVGEFVLDRLQRGRRDMSVMAASLVDTCLHKDSRDNMTAVVVAFTPWLAALGGGEGCAYPPTPPPLQLLRLRGG